MIMHVYNSLKSCKNLNNCVIATDSVQILEEISRYNPKVVRTGACSSGTFRVIEAAKSLQDFDILINVQGDEPMITEAHIDALIGVFEDNPEAEIATLVEQFTNEKDLRNPHNVKVVLSKSNKALYFSRSVIPYSETLEPHHHKHIGVYGFRKRILKTVEELPMTELRRQEQLEQLDWLAAEIPIFAKFVEGHLISVDTQADLDAVRKKLS